MELTVKLLHVSFVQCVVSLLLASLVVIFNQSHYRP
jgi:hypothetical protein